MPNKNDPPRNNAICDLMHAIHCHDEKTLKKILENDPTLANTYPLKSLRSPLVIAYDLNAPKNIIDLLVAYGAKATIDTSNVIKDNNNNNVQINSDDKKTVKTYMNDATSDTSDSIDLDSILIKDLQNLNLCTAHITTNSYNDQPSNNANNNNDIDKSDDSNNSDINHLKLSGELALQIIDKIIDIVKHNL